MKRSSPESPSKLLKSQTPRPEKKKSPAQREFYH
jgi:hypothetical protein